MLGLTKPGCGRLRSAEKKRGTANATGVSTAAGISQAKLLLQLKAMASGTNANTTLPIVLMILTVRKRLLPSRVPLSTPETARIGTASVIHGNADITSVRNSDGIFMTFSNN